MFAISIARETCRKRIALWLVPAAALVLAMTVAAQTTIDFEDLAPGTTVTSQYGSRGVVFQQAFLDAEPPAPVPGNHFLRSANPSAEIFTPIPLPMTFTSAQGRVRFVARNNGVAANGTFLAFDAANNVVAQDGPKSVAADAFTTLFQVTDPDTTPSIVRAELRIENSAHFAIDNLEFQGLAPTEPPPAPVVQITTPQNGAELDVSTIDIAGTVTGEGVVSPVKLTLVYRQPPESTAPPFGSDLVLTGTGTTRQFSLRGFTGVPLGPITITVTAENFGGLQGTRSITFTNLPTAVRNRFTAEGGAATFGAFRFGVRPAGCTMAVYEQGAIALDGGGATRLIRGQVLTKWLALRGNANETGFFGCPLGDEREATEGSRAQDFQRGRIYSHPTVGTFSVPTVFTDAIDKRGGEEAIGVPIAEPTSSSGVSQTWLFQRFTRPSHSTLVPSTIEIRGAPPTPTLWIERQPSNLRVPTTGTIYEEFPCSDLQGPCTVEPPPAPGEPIRDAGNKFCEGTTYPFGPPEWVPILGHHISTPLFGVAVNSHLAGEDNPLTHEYIYEIDCPLKVDCPSDWNVAVHPVGPPRGIAPHQSYVAENTYVELEYEQYYAQVPHIFFDWPQIGELIFAAGRFIIDCGHTPYRTELHPIFMFSKMKSEKFQGHLATRADIWVNGWYPGDLIEFDIFPPPRPSPDARLTVSKPVDADASFNVNVEFDMLPGGNPNHARVRFTAEERKVDVTDAGEMIWQTRRGYMGQWFLFWTEP
jgi:hypothetical protein